MKIKILLNIKPWRRITGWLTKMIDDKTVPGTEEQNNYNVLQDKITSIFVGKFA